MIQTQYEVDGSWSSSEFGQQFMIDLSADSGVPLFSIGQAHLGSEIYGMKFGSGDKTLIITGGVHRSEPASREMVMMKTRGMAYNSNGAYNELFNYYTVYSIPTVNPETGTRSNAQGLDINRDAYSLETTEMPLLMKFITEKDPHIYIDFHERSGLEDMKLEFIDPSHLDPNAQSDIKSGASDMEFHIRNYLESNNFSTSRYPQSLIGMGKTVAVRAMLGAITSTPETHMSIPSENRVDGQKTAFDGLVSWCLNNQQKIEQVYNDFRSKPLTSGEKYTLINGDNDYFLSATMVPIQTPKGYLIEDGEDFDKWIATYGIEVDETGFVPINQKAGRIIPQLLDPIADNKVVNATRIEPPEPEKRTDGRYTKVKYDDWEEVFIKNYQVLPGYPNNSILF